MLKFFGLENHINNHNKMEGYPSIVEYFSEQKKESCGYCSSKVGSYSYGLHAHVLTVEDYQNMIDRGWRRCGQYCYKSLMEKTCCPLYTIRCATKDFKLSKTQKKILKRVNNFLATGKILKEKSFKKTEIVQSMDISEICVSNKPSFMNIGETITFNKKPEEGEKKEMKVDQQLGEEFISKHTKRDNIISGIKPIKNKTNKAKCLRIERKRLKLQKLGLSEAEVAKKMIEKKKYPVIKTLEDYINETSLQNQLHKLKISLVRSFPRSKEFEATFSVAFDLYKKYQMIIHKDPPDKITKRQFERFLVVSPLQIHLVSVRSLDFKNTYNEAAALFAKYQKSIHRESDEDCDEIAFNGFLVETPLKASNVYGSYHQQYWLDNKLIAVGVIDILPKCVSSVYFFYDPDYSHLSLGTYGALREVEFTRTLTSRLPDLNFYYMGFYIHSCVKMKYKAAFRPSQLLCPEVCTWHPVENCVPKLNKEKYSRLNEDLSAIDLNSKVSSSDVLVLYNRTAMPLTYYLNQKKCTKEELEEIMEYARLVGRLCYEKILLSRM